MRVQRYLVAIIILISLGYGWYLSLSCASRALAQQEKLLREADEYLDNDIVLKAIRALEYAASYQTKERDKVKLKLALTYKEAGYIDKYKNTLQKLIVNQTINEDVYYELASYYYGNGEYKQAIDTIKYALGKINSSKILEYYNYIRYKTYNLYCQFTEVKEFSNGLAPVFNNDKWGYTNTQGNIVIDFIFDKACAFVGDNALVIKDGKVAFINRQGFNITVAKFRAANILGLYEKRAAVQINNKWHFIDKNFNKSQSNWDKVGSFYNGLVAVKSNGLWGVRDINGDYLIKPQYRDIVLDRTGRCMVGDVSFVKEFNNYFLVDLKGERVSQDSWAQVRAFLEEDTYAAVKKNTKWGFIDSKGNEVLPFIWDEAKSFCNGLAAVKINNKWGFINTSGEVVVELAYDDVRSFSEGLAGVKKHNNWSFIGLYEYQRDSNIFSY